MTWPWRELEGLLAAGKALVSGSPAAASQAAVRAAADRVVGRELTMRVGDADVTLTPTEIDAEIDPVGLALGQVPRVRIAARDVTWPGTPVHELAIVADDLRFQSIPSPSVLVGDVDVRITLTADVVKAKVAEVQPNLVVDIGDDSVMRVRWAPRRTWGHLEVEPVVVDQGVHLCPKVLQLGGMRLRAVERLRPTVVELPDLPRGLRLTGVELGAGHLVLRGETEQWHQRIPLTELLTWLATTAATFTLPQFPGRDTG